MKSNIPGPTMTTKVHSQEGIKYSVNTVRDSEGNVHLDVYILAIDGKDTVSFSERIYLNGEEF